MLPVSRREIEALREVGLLKEKRTGFVPQEPNYTVLNKFHKSRAKTYAVVESPEVMQFLEKWELCNLQEITKEQFEKLKSENKLSENNIQLGGTYVPGAIGFISRDGRYFVQKVAKLLIPIGIWRSKGSKGY